MSGPVPQGPQPPAPPFTAARRTNGLAIAAFILGLLWVCGLGSLLAIVFGLVALSQMKKRGEGGHGFEIAGIVLGGLALAGTAVFVVAGAVATNEVSDSIEAELEREARDVEIGQCAADDLGQLSASVVVTNNSSKTSDYVIEVNFTSEDGAQQFDTATVVVNGLQSGQRTEQDAISFTVAPESFVCGVQNVQRFASP